jgi:hypothetical protein
MNGHVPVKFNIITKMQKSLKKNIFLEIHWARQAQIYIKASGHSAYSSLYKWGEIIFTSVYWKELVRRKNLANFNQTWYKSFLHERNSSLFKWSLQRKVISMGGSQKYKNRSFTYFLLMNHRIRKAQIYRRASWHRAESFFFLIHGPWGLWGTTIG